MAVVSEGDEAQLAMIRERNQMGDSEANATGMSGAAAATAGAGGAEEEKKDG